MDATLTVSIYDALVILGVTMLAIPHIYRILWFYFLRPSSVKRYLHESGPYAVVAGATDGIGKATAAELLRRGFNLILHGRDEEKMQRVVEDLRASVTMNIRYFIADASKNDHEWEKLLEPFKELHTTVVVHNVLARGLDNDELVFGAPTGVQFTYLSVGTVHSDNHPAPMPPSLGVPTSARFACPVDNLNSRNDFSDPCLNVAA